MQISGTTRLHAGGLYVTAAIFEDLPWLVHASSTRRFSPPDADRVTELWHLQQTLKLPRLPMVHADQRHTNSVGVITQEILASIRPDGRYRFPQTDAIVSPFPGVSLAIFTADCAPIFLVDTRTRATALVHAGWQGTFSRIAEKAVEAMLACGSRAEDLLAWVGPMAGGCCYEVSEELIRRFAEEFEDAAAEGVRIHHGRMLDLVAVNVHQLMKAGLLDDRIARSQLCTIHGHETFYSYRADKGTTGRIISMITARGD